MLASLDEIPGVRASRVDWTGTRFLLELERSADVEDVLDAAEERLGDAERLEPDEERRAARGFARGGESWMRADQTIELSRAEARILAEERVRALPPEARLAPAQRERLVAVVAAEIAAAFERIHERGEGLPDDAGATFEEVRRRVLERARSFLTGDQLRLLEDVSRPDAECPR